MPNNPIASESVPEVASLSGADAARQIAELRLELQRMRKEKAELASVISHDLRGPLRAVRLFAQVIEQDCADALPVQVAAGLTHIKAGGAKLEELIAGLVALMRLNQDPAPVRWVELEPVVNRVLEELQDEVALCAADITVDVPYKVLAQAEPVRTVILQLLRNALKFRLPGRAPKIEIGASLEREAMVQLHVSDNGLGIQPELQADIFRPFRRLHLPEKYPGLGLGLSICRSIVEANGGQIWLKSTPEVGSTFYVTFPRPT